MHRLDPYLAYLTRNSHFSLLAIGTFLMIPALLFAFAITFTISTYKIADVIVGDPRTLGITLACLTGILAWTALALLLFKRSDPIWHLACWAMVGLFGAIAIPSVIFWLAERPQPLVLLLPVLAGGIGALFFSVWNIQRALASLKRTRQVQDLASGE